MPEFDGLAVMMTEEREHESGRRLYLVDLKKLVAAVNGVGKS